MRLISCYIGGFGTFFNQTFDLSSNLVVIKQDNGWGKTTLVSFLECMLFGMEAGRNKAVGENMRLRYEPWRGGAYGGTLTFSLNGKTYRIERSFGKTPALDTVRLYDQNNMACYDFGEKAEKLGETVFGMNGESYRKSVYIPQGEIYTDALSDDIKSRLYSLLSTGGTKIPASENALDRLNDADRSLRAKRKPAKGKLDEIDEKLTDISREKGERKEDLASVHNLRMQIADLEKGILECAQRIGGIDKDLDTLSRQKELERARERAQEMKNHMQKAEEELASLQEFFGDTNPEILNIEGLRVAVEEFYRLKNRLQEVEDKISQMQASVLEKAGLKAQFDECEKALDSLDAVLSRSKGKRWRKRGKKIPGKMNKTLLSVFFVSILVAIAGAIMAVLDPPFSYIGLAFAGAGVISIAICFLLMLPRRERLNQGVKVAEGMEAEVSAQYDETYERWKDLKEKISKYPENLEEEFSALTEEKKDLFAQLSEKYKSIRGFLQNFRFTEEYDFRSALSLLVEKREQFLSRRKDFEASAERYKNLSVTTEVETKIVGDKETLLAHRKEWESKKDDLIDQRAKISEKIEVLGRKVPLAELDAQEKELLQEKTRLEKRHTAILRAKEFLAQAKENMASRYLDGVEKGCLRYLKALGGNEGLRFSADGSTVCEDRGRLREMAYYSVGSKELVGFCVRIALADCLFQGETPVLVLDDPFVNLDDEKTEKAKRLTKELSKKYQILYLTCKQERKL